MFVSALHSIDMQIRMRVSLSSALFSLSLRLISHSHAAPISAAVADYIQPVKEKKMFLLFFRWIWKIQFSKGNGIYYHFNNSWPWTHVPVWQESRTGSIDVMDARIIALWNSEMALVRAALLWPSAQASDKPTEIKKQ